AHAVRTREPLDIRHPRVASTRDVQLAYRARAQRLEHRVDAGDVCHAPPCPSRAESADTNAAARSRQPATGATPEAAGSSAAASMAGTSRSSSGPLSRPVRTTRSVWKSARPLAPLRART